MDLQKKTKIPIKYQKYLPSNKIACSEYLSGIFGVFYRTETGSSFRYFPWKFRVRLEAPQTRLSVSSLCLLQFPRVTSMRVATPAEPSKRPPHRGLLEPLWEANFLGEPRGGLRPSDGDPLELSKCQKSYFLRTTTKHSIIVFGNREFHA